MYRLVNGKIRKSPFAKNLTSELANYQPGTPVLVKFIHDKATGRRRGVIVATGNGKVGWSLCNFDEGDVYNEEKALNIAAGRSFAVMGLEVPKYYPLYKDYLEMVNRSQRYFKEENKGVDHTKLSRGFKGFVNKLLHR